jgi:RNA polymerase sigma-70 factor (ECF subfamily)
MTFGLTTKDDGELIARIAEDGDAQCMGALFERHQAEVRRFLAYVGVSSSDVPDLVQNTFIEVMRGASRSFDGRPDARSWLFGIAARVARRHRYSVIAIAKRAAAWALEPPKVEATPSERYDTREAGARATRALSLLSTKKREVFVMVVLEDMPCDEVAASLGIPVATVWTRLHHARRELREHLADEEKS